MASFNNKTTRMTLRVQTGTTGLGDPIYKSVGWGNIAAGATADQMDTLAQALEPLFSAPVGEVQRSAVDQVLQFRFFMDKMLTVCMTERNRQERRCDTWPKR